MAHCSNLRGFLCAVVVCSTLVTAAPADTFGTGADQFTIDFVALAGDSNPGNGAGVVTYDYGMGVYEITNSQWSKFISAHGPVTGAPSSAYDDSPYYKGVNQPTQYVSWYEAAQFVNWLNTSTGHQPAYRFEGAGSWYELKTWDSADAAGGTNLYRHKDAKYCLPTIDEWIKAAYWNGTEMQTYANASPGDLEAGVPDPEKWNYLPSTGLAPWSVGSGAQELNGTYDMMGNLWEWMESPFDEVTYQPGSNRGLQGGAYNYDALRLESTFRDFDPPNREWPNSGFRVVAREEPGTMTHVLCVGIDHPVDPATGKYTGPSGKNAESVFAQLKRILPNWCPANRDEALILDASNSGVGNLSEIKAELDSIRARLAPDDSFVLYVGSHGYIVDDNEGEKSVLLSDTAGWGVSLNNRSDERLSLTNNPLGVEHDLSDDTLTAWMLATIGYEETSAWNGVDKLFMIDACHSGGFEGDHTEDDGDLDKLERYALMASCPEWMTTLYLSSSGDLVWTKLLVEAIEAGRDLSAAIEYLSQLSTDDVLGQFEEDDLDLALFEKGLRPDGDLTYFSWEPQFTKSSDFQGVPNVPEPATLGLLSIGGLAMIRRRNA